MVIVFTLNDGQHFAYMSHTPMKKVNGTTHKSVNTHTVVVPKNATETHVFNIERIEVGLNASYSISVESYL
ncbi:MAG: hypothetical protein [Bacteriophage sp.]|nr:MAG: hypothetical protein [Bacteriophage sp.]